MVRNETWYDGARHETRYERYETRRNDGLSLQYTSIAQPIYFTKKGRAEGSSLFLITLKLNGEIHRNDLFQYLTVPLYYHFHETFLPQIAPDVVPLVPSAEYIFSA